jgi:hypothetical protein
MRYPENDRVSHRRLILGTIVTWAAVCFIVPICIAQSPDQPALVMKPFKVFAEMVELRPIINKREPSRPVQGILVAGVLKKSPAEKAGIKKGMVITHIQDMAVSGQTEKQLHESTAKLMPTSRNTIVVRAKKSYSSKGELIFEILLPEKSNAIPSKK